MGSWFNSGLRSSTESSSGPAAFGFSINVKATINSFSVVSTPRACVTGHWGGFDDIESELVIVCVEKSAKEPRPPSEDKPGSGSILNSSSRIYCELTFRVSSILRGLIRWKSPL